MVKRKSMTCDYTNQNRKTCTKRIYENCMVNFHNLRANRRQKNSWTKVNIREFLCQSFNESRFFGIQMEVIKLGKYIVIVLQKGNSNESCDCEWRVINDLHWRCYTEYNSFHSLSVLNRNEKTQRKTHTFQNAYPAFSPVFFSHRISMWNCWLY